MSQQGSSEVVCFRLCYHSPRLEKRKLAASAPIPARPLLDYDHGSRLLTVFIVPTLCPHRPCVFLLFAFYNLLGFAVIAIVNDLPVDEELNCKLYAVNRSDEPFSGYMQLARAVCHLEI